MAQPLASGSFTTPAAKAQTPAICDGKEAFPTPPALARTEYALPATATHGTPQIDQIRGGKVVDGQVMGGKVIATWRQFASQNGCQLVPDAKGLFYVTPEDTAKNPNCGPFTRVPNFRVTEPGDIFLEHTAVYASESMQPWIGPVYDSPAAYAAGDPDHPLQKVSIIGQITNGQQPAILINGGASSNTLNQAPVYFDASTDMVWSHVDVVAKPGASVGKAGVYDNGTNGLVFEYSRIIGFEVANANGFFTTSSAVGPLKLLNDELAFDGGGGGYAHNVYISGYGAQVTLEHSWTHDAYQGHLFKTRASQNDIQANYFQGGLPQGGAYGQAESFDLDVSNGGLTTIKDNVFYKTKSGSGTAQSSLCWDCEGNPDGRAESIVLQNNTFVAGALTEDGNYQLVPVSYLYPQVNPGGAGWPGYPYQVLNNVYANYCVTGNAPLDYRGDVWVNAVTSNLTSDHGLSAPVYSNDAAIKKRYPAYNPIVGAPSYVHQTSGKTRQTNAIGAMDH